MAVKTSIQIQGSALSALGKMTTALNKVITRFERLQQVLSSNVNTQGLDRINRCLSQMQKIMEATWLLNAERMQTSMI